MGIKERREMEILELKRKIIGAAIELIGQEGYEKLSLRKIAAKIQYSPTTIYLYYKDKAEIIKDMAAVLYQKIENNAAAIINNNSTHSADIQMKDILNIVIQSLCDEPEMAKAIMYSKTQAIFANETQNNTPTNSGISSLNQLISLGISQNIFKPDREGTAWMLISALLGFVMCAVENELYKLEYFDQLKDEFVNILMTGIQRSTD